MTAIHDDAESFAATALDGFCAAYPRRVRRVRGGVLRATTTPPGKVALVVGGGSGHYPAFAGYVGPGLADAAVAGDVFASPSTEAIVNVARLASRNGGILLGFGNYAGDVLNFGMAAQKLAEEGLDVRLLAVADDVASAPAARSRLRRGVAGDLVVFKIAGAAAERGMSLEEVERVAQRANANTISFGVAFGGCTLPGARQPLFTVPAGRMAVGLGIHGEPGIAEETVLSATDLGALLVDRLLAERPSDSSGRVAAVLNGLGCSKYEELFVLWMVIRKRLEAAGLELVEPEVGEFVTSLDMAGCSLTLTWLDDELQALWTAPVDAAVLHRGSTGPSEMAEAPMSDAAAVIVTPPATPASRAAGRCVSELLARLAKAMAGAEEDLGRLDAIAGDGDHGQAMKRGTEAAAVAAEAAVAAGAGVATLLARAADAWAGRAGGTSGALWGAALRSWSEALSDSDAPSPQAIADGASAARMTVGRLGGGKVGDKTMLEAFDPFATSLSDGVGKGRTLARAWSDAAAAASAGAEASAALAPKLGRARPLAARSVGHRDAGAVSLALCAVTAAAFIAARAGPNES